MGGGFDNVPTGANCAWETYKYIRRNRVAWKTVGAIVLTSRDRVTTKAITTTTVQAISREKQRLIIIWKQC